MDKTIETLNSEFSSSEWPDFLSIKVDANTCTLGVRVYKDIRWFEGHFPEQPVLAGVVQTHWAGELGRYIFSITQDFLRIDNLKFQNVILPDIDISIGFEYMSTSNAIKFRFYDDQNVYSEGKILFATE